MNPLEEAKGDKRKYQQQLDFATDRLNKFIDDHPDDYTTYPSFTHLKEEVVSLRALVVSSQQAINIALTSEQGTFF